MPTSHFLSVLGVRTHYLAAGDSGPTIILLHGGGIDCASLSWAPLLADLPGCRVLAPDLPGYGESGPAPAQSTAENTLAFTRAFLDALDIRRASLVGISMGGMLALGTALSQPERVEKLVLVDSYGLQRRAAFHRLSYLFVKIPGVNALSWAMMRSRPMIRWSLKALLARPGAITPQLVDEAYDLARKPGANQAWTGFQNSEMTWAGTRTCYLDRLSEITAPTLIVHGTQDGAVPPACAREAAARIPGARLRWMEGCGHWPQRDNPAEFNRVVKEFLCPAGTIHE